MSFPDVLSVGSLIHACLRIDLVLEILEQALSERSVKQKLIQYSDR